ncbi:MAG: carboxymuconolactone decarboxylase family protein [Candidatus Bathyarchaeia archaeon]|nr:carboxymuconolactone decarboxylase family protein [Candidatus Bathyarchaeota archaeon]
MRRRVEDFKGGFEALSKGNPRAAEGFSTFMDAILEDGALDAKTKGLIALAAALAAGCESCVAVYVQRSLAAGATRDEVSEAAGVAVLVGGASALARMAEVERALDEFAWRQSI